MLEMLVYDDLQKNAAKILHPSQHGFIKGHSTQDNLRYVATQIKNNLKNGYLFFIDLKSAFDLVPRNLVYQQLKALNILSDTQIDILKFIHDNMHIQLGKSSCMTTVGTAQGMLTPPMLFNIVFDGLIRILADSNTLTSEYADDLVSLQESINGVIATINRIEKWINETHMQINKKIRHSMPR